VKLLLSNPRIVRVVIISVAAWLCIGWLLGDDWRWTLLRALGGTATIIGAALLYTSNRPIVRVGRVTLGALLGGWCANTLGGDYRVGLATAAAFAALLIGAEYLIERDLRRRTPSP
jgi:uncharacterized membrane protein YqgA involved in biofilm formation